MLKALLIFRPLNVFLIAAFQGITYYFLNFDAFTDLLFRPDFLLMLVALALVSAAGYAINDFFDQIADRLNKPERCYYDRWNPTIFFGTYTLLSVVGIYLAFELSNAYGLYVTSIGLVLFAYSKWFQKQPLIGNVVVSLCTASSITIVYYIFKEQNFLLVLFFTLFAFLLTLVRELVKDIQDVEGDKQAGYKTLAVLTENRSSSALAGMILFFSLVLYIVFQYRIGPIFFRGYLFYVYFAYQLMCVVLPMYYLWYRVRKANIQSDWATISSGLKYIMATGVAAMMFF